MSNVALLSNENAIRVTSETERFCSLNEDLLWGYAFSWVVLNRGKIAGRAKKFMPYSPYTKRDFLQQSYIAAYSAIKKSLKTGEYGTFEQFFWIELKREYSSMATIPSRRELLGDDASLLPCIHEEYSENGNRKRPATRQSRKSMSLQKLSETGYFEAEFTRNSSIQKALALMTVRQRQVWKFLLGYHGQIPTTGEIGRRIGISRQGVEKLMNKGLRKVEKYFSYERREIGR
jgi:hypothetical protein